MAKHGYKFYLEEEAYKMLLEKAGKVGINGWGAISKYLDLLARSDIILLDRNLKDFIKVLNLEVKQEK